MVKKFFNSSLIRTAGVYGGTSILNAAIPFLIMPILTRNMAPADYGIVSIFTVLVTFISPIIGLSTNGAIARQYFNQEKINIKEYVANCFILLMISSVLVIIVFFLFSNIIGRFSNFPSSWLWAVVLVAFCNFIISVVTTLWQVQSKPISYGKFQIGQTLLNVLLSLLLVVVLKQTWQGRINAQLVTAVIFAFIGGAILVKDKWISLVLNKEYLKHALKFGLPLIPHTLGAVLMTMSDRLFITNMVSLSSAGLYSVGYALGSIIGFFENAFNLAFAPWLFEQLNKNSYQVKKRIVKLTYVYFLVILILAFFLSVLGPWFLSFFVGEKFINAQVFIVWIAFGFAFSGMYKMVVNYLFYIEKTNILSWITFFSAILNLPLNYLLIKKFGAVGAAMATTIVSALFFFFTWLLSSRYYKMPWMLKKSTNNS